MTAPETIAVTVEERHIAAGVPRRSLACPIALALRDVTGDVWEVAVDRAWTVAWLGAGPLMVDLPRDAKEWIGRFDVGGPVGPATFTLRAAGENVR